MKTIFLCETPSSFKMVYTDEQKARIASISELAYPQLLSTKDIDSVDLSDVEVIFSTWGMPSLTAEQLDRMPKLRAVFYAAGATNHFAPQLLERGILVSSAWRANGVPVAEFALAQIILSLKHYFRDNRNYNAPEKHHEYPYGPGSYGETVALVGNGAVSTHLKKLLNAVLTVNVIQIPTKDPNLREKIAEAFKSAYVVSNHLPNLPETENIFSEELFRSMRKNATFINTGRGAQVDEAGMIRALKDRKDLTALPDVTYPEPPVAGSPLYTMPNVHLSSHLAGSLNDETHRMAETEIEEFIRFTKGLPLENLVSAEDVSVGKRKE
ncbi:MAG: hydroxyacid dehydrogenase [Lentisphaeria bacterium]|nr:hydroxyacid dehydrogenase [Lentisphaeria bacterium]